MASLTSDTKKHFRVHYGKNEFVRGKLILMESRASGGILKPDWLDSEVFIKKHFFYI